MYRSTIKLLLLISLCSLLMGGNAIAERQAGAFTLSPMAGYHVIDGGMDLDDAAVFSLGAGYNITSRWAVEADLRFAPTETSGSNSKDVDIWTTSLGGLYHFTPKYNLTPYFSLGAGVMIYDLESGEDDEDYYGYYGGGLKYALSKSVDLRLDARHLLNYRSDSSFSANDNEPDWRHHLQAMAGMSFQFGAPAASVSEPAPVPVAKEEVDPVADNDHDGVLNSQDKCLDTAAGVRVDSVGCPADTDADGVADYRDACVDTPENAEVDQRGCPEEAKEISFLTRDILFGFDKDQVTPFHYSELKKAAEFADMNPMFQVVVEGHADDSGTPRYNVLLSQRRAENVRQILINKYGIAAHRITTIGFGLTWPIAGNETAEERMKNRRAEINIHP